MNIFEEERDEIKFEENDEKSSISNFSIKEEQEQKEEEYENVIKIPSGGIRENGAS